MLRHVLQQTQDLRTVMLSRVQRCSRFRVSAVEIRERALLGMLQVNIYDQDVGTGDPGRQRDDGGFEKSW